MTTRFLTSSVLAPQIKSPGAPSLSSQLGPPTFSEPPPFIDLTKTARGWINIGGGGTTDNDGNLTGMTGAGLTANFSLNSWTSGKGNGASVLNGEYVIRWLDNGSGATASIPLGATITQTQTVVAGQSGYDREMRATMTFGGGRRVDFSGIDGANPPSNLQFVSVENLERYEAGEVFQPDLIRMFKDNTYCMRFMQWGRVWGHSNYPSDYSQWQTETSQVWNRIPVSVMCRLCNEINSHMWLCFPVTATNQMVADMIDVVAANLDAGRLFFPEFCNEIWNPGPGNITTELNAGLQADWPSVTSPTREDHMSWAGKRLVEILDIAEPVLGADRVKGVMGGWQNGSGGSSANAAVLDAPTWHAQDPVNYEAPHTRAALLAVTDYYGTADGLSNAVMADFDAGDLAAARRGWLEYFEAAIAGVKSSLDGVYAEKGVADTVLGTVRDIEVGFYEGGSNHANPRGGETAAWYLPPSFAASMSVVSGQCVKNPSTGRVYQSQTEGVAGSTTPSHLTGDVVTLDGIDWLDLTGDVIGNTADFTLRDSSAIGESLASDRANVQTYAAQAWSVGDYIETSAGRVYRVLVGGTASAEPTHMSGDVETGGVTYRYVEQYLGEREMRVEVYDWLLPQMMGAETARQIIDLWEYSKSVGYIMPNCYIMVGTIDEYGFFSSSVSFADQGDTKTYDRGDIVRAWSQKYAPWWQI